MKLPQTLLLAVAVAGCQDSLASGRGARGVVEAHEPAPEAPVAVIPEAQPVRSVRPAPRAAVAIIPEATQPIEPVRTVKLPEPTIVTIEPRHWEGWDCPACGMG